MMSMNAHGYIIDKNERLQLIRLSLEKHQIDIVLFNEANAKQNAINISRVEKRMKRMNRGVQTNTADSKQYKSSDKDCLLAGLQ